MASSGSEWAGAGGSGAWSGGTLHMWARCTCTSHVVMAPVQLACPHAREMRVQLAFAMLGVLVQF
eukprot:14478981-Alexandrium_andersonii.AAC.1